MSVLLPLPYLAAILLWVQCARYARCRAVDLRNITGEGSLHRSAFPVACLATVAATAGLARGAEDGGTGFEMTMLLLLVSLILNLYLAYVVMFHGAWILVWVLRCGEADDPAAGLKAAFTKHCRHKRLLRVCFAAVVALFVIAVALLSAVVWLSAPHLPDFSAPPSLVSTAIGASAQV